MTNKFIPAGIGGLVGLTSLLAAVPAPALANGMAQLPPACEAIELNRPMTDEEIKDCFIHLILMERQSRDTTIILGSNGGSKGAGIKGDKGTTGARGKDGADGPAGVTGAAGATGLTGPTGDTGATGATGDKGDTGEQGDPGDNG